MTDIVERLRKENSMPPYYGPPAVQMDAAAEIERLRAALRLVRQQCPDKKPPPAFDQWGDMIADNAERHAERVSAEDRWGIAEIVDAALEERT